MKALSHAATAVLQAVANGHEHGFDIMANTGLPSGTVYPALRRLEETAWLRSRWEEHRVARDELRPPRKYYEITKAGETRPGGGAGALPWAGEKWPDR